jgi:hypothetical protein
VPSGTVAPANSASRRSAKPGLASRIHWRRFPLISQRPETGFLAADAGIYLGAFALLVYPRWGCEASAVAYNGRVKREGALWFV